MTYYALYRYAKEGKLEMLYMGMNKLSEEEQREALAWYFNENFDLNSLKSGTTYQSSLRDMLDFSNIMSDYQELDIDEADWDNYQLCQYFKLYFNKISNNKHAYIYK
ncbi:unnamed protein product [Gordionus sp. m RMFG-2023]